MKIAIRTMLLMLMALPFVANADPIELVENGEFETPEIDGSWALVADTTVPGWACTHGVCEIWKQGILGPEPAPEQGSDGLDTGQHHEINASNVFSISSNGSLLAFDAIGALAFDVWDRTGYGALMFMVDAIGPNARNLFTSDLITLSSLGPNNAWYELGVSGLELMAGDEIKVSFQDFTTSGCLTCGVHIDGVSLLAYAVPEPGTLGLLGLGLIGLGFRNKRRATN